jgi:hypothetical protein
MKEKERIGGFIVDNIAPSSLAILFLEKCTPMDELNDFLWHE